MNIIVFNLIMLDIYKFEIISIFQPVAYRFAILFYWWNGDRFVKILRKREDPLREF